MRTRLTRSIAVSTALFALSLLHAAGAADLGSPPSGEIPILFNDHTVYAKPDTLTQNRVLAALVKDGQIYVPLRSMFEQMGATVSVSSNGKTITADKPGSSVSVTLGKSEVIVNGETRPLDVPPMLYQGVVLVPVRVISEAMGAYVQWVPDRHVVVVRYIAIAPRAAAAGTCPTARPTVATAPVVVPTSAAHAESRHSPTLPRAGARIVHRLHPSRILDTEELQRVRGRHILRYVGLQRSVRARNAPFALKADFRQDAYVTSSNAVDALGNHYTQFATIDGGIAFAPVFMARQTSLDIRLEYQVLKPRIYAGVAYLHDANNYGYPNLNAVGVGLEKLPDLRPGLSLYGSAFYYPNASGTYTVGNPASPNAGASYQQQYQIIKYDIGVALVIAHSPVYLFGGFSGDHYAATKNAPAGQIHAGPYIGLGVKI